MEQASASAGAASEMPSSSKNCAGCDVAVGGPWTCFCVGSRCVPVHCRKMSGKTKKKCNKDILKLTDCPFL